LCPNKAFRSLLLKATLSNPQEAHVVNQEYIQYRIDLVNRFEPAIIDLLRHIISSYNLRNATIKQRNNPWFTDLWCIFAQLETAPIRFRGGIRLEVDANTRRYSFEVITLSSDDIQSMLIIRKTCSSLEDVIPFFNDNGIEPFLDSGDLRLYNIQSLHR